MQKHRFNIKRLFAWLKIWLMVFLMHFGATVAVGVTGMRLYGEAATSDIGLLVVCTISTAIIVWLLLSTVRINRG